MAPPQRRRRWFPTPRRRSRVRFLPELLNRDCRRAMLDEQSSAAVLRRRLLECSATIAVIGLVYVGLPLAKRCLASGFAVIGIDTDPHNIDALNHGRPYIQQEGADLFTAIAAKGFQPTSDFASLANADAILI